MYLLKRLPSIIKNSGITESCSIARCIARKDAFRILISSISILSTEATAKAYIDEELFEQARQGVLRRNLDAQVRRMLRDPKSRALTENFANQWLQTRNVKNATPDPDLFKDFDDALQEMLASKGPYVLEVMVPYQEHVLPMIPSGRTVRDIIKA